VVAVPGISVGFAASEHDAMQSSSEINIAAIRAEGAEKQSGKADLGVVAELNTARVVASFCMVFLFTISPSLYHRFASVGQGVFAETRIVQHPVGQSKGRKPWKAWLA
jgi:hypothetical protein